MLKRMENGSKLMEYLNSLEDIKWDNIDRIVDSLATYWVASSNFKVNIRIESGRFEFHNSWLKALFMNPNWK